MIFIYVIQKHRSHCNIFNCVAIYNCSAIKFRLADLFATLSTMQNLRNLLIFPMISYAFAFSADFWYTLLAESPSADKYELSGNAWDNA